MVTEKIKQTIIPANARRLFDLGGTNIRVAWEENGAVHDLQTFSSKNIKSRNDMAKIFSDIILADINNGSSQRIFVLSVAGPVCDDLRTIEQLTNILPEDKFINLSELIEKQVADLSEEKISFFLMNDGYAGTIAEMTRGSLMEAQLGIAIIVGTGVGGGACHRDKQGYIHPYPFPREFGHWSVDITNTTTCNCGRTGCLETQTSGPAAERLARELAAADPVLYQNSILHQQAIQPDKINGKNLSLVAQQGDTFALTILNQVTRPMACVINNIFTSAPEMRVAIVGGLGLGFGELYIQALKNHIMDTGMSFHVEPKHLIATRLDRQITLGSLSPDTTNMIGTREFLRQQEVLAQRVTTTSCEAIS